MCSAGSRRRRAFMRRRRIASDADGDRHYTCSSQRIAKASISIRKHARAQHLGASRLLRTRESF